ERRGVPCKPADEPFVPNRSVQLEEEVAHLVLGAGGQLGDRGKGARNRAGGVGSIPPELALGGAGVEGGREERLRDGVVQVSGDPVALLEGPLTRAAPGPLEPQGAAL